MSHKIEIFSDRRNTVGEGPFWDAINNALLYVDVINGMVCRLNPETKVTETRKFDDFASTVFPIINQPELLVSLGSKLSKLNFETGQHEAISSIDHVNNTVRFNDGKCDSVGRLWIGTMGVETEPGVFAKEKGALYKVDQSNFSLSKQVDKVSISNGLAWSADSKTMYYIDSLAQRIDAFDYDIRNGTISRRRTVANFKDDDGLPDGMTIDQQGHLWVAFFNGYKVIELDPKTGKTLRKIDLPAGQITSCCFGGPNYEDLYVTCGSVYLTEDQLKSQPAAGHIFRVTGLNAKGFPGSKFAC